MKRKVKFTIERQTKGAVLYKEVDSKGAAVSQGSAVVGSLYVRKNGFPDGVIPQHIEVEITTTDFD